MNDSTKNVLVAALLGFCLAALVAIFLILGMIRHDEDAAVRRGVAEYYLDDNHQRQFRWKECGE